MSTAAILAWMILAPTKLPSAGAFSAHSYAVATAEHEHELLPPLETFAAIWERSSLAGGHKEDPPPPAAADPPRPPLRVQVLATAVEADRSHVVLLDDRNVIQVRQVDEKVNDAQVIEIQRHQVRLDHRGEVVTLVVPLTHGDRSLQPDRRQEVPHEAETGTHTSDAPRPMATGPSR